MKTLKTFFVLLAAPLIGVAQQIITPVQRQQELGLLKKTLTTLHPGVYRYETPEQIDEIFKVAQMKAVHPMPESRYMILLAQLVTNVHCGHTYTNYWNQPRQVSGNLYSQTCLPVLYRMIGRQMIVTNNLTDVPLIKPGDEVIAINGISVKRIVDSLLTVSPSDGKHGIARKLDNISIRPGDADTSNYNLADIFIPLFFPVNFNKKNYSLTLQHFSSKNIFKVSVRAMTKKERLLTYNQRFGTLPVHEKNWSVRKLNENTACFVIGDFETWEWKADYKKILDSVFTQLKENGFKNLVIDIRGNGGGDDEARDIVFSYLIDRPFGCSDPMHRRYRFLSVPDTLVPYLSTWNKSFKQAKNPENYVQSPDGLFESKADLNTPCVPVEPNHNYFRGKKFLLIDGRNASTTFTMAKMFKTEKAGEIYGEPTGGNQQGINGGQFFFLNLPFSKIEIDIPLIWGAYSGKRPDTGIVPDYLVKTSRASIAAGKDPQLAVVLSAISRRQR